MNTRRRSPVLRLIAWMLAFLVPLHGMAAGLALALGPAHTHKVLPGVRMVLDDLRRAPPARMTLIGAPSSAVGHRHAHGGGNLHFHADGGIGRHYHAVGDPTVVPSVDAHGDGPAVSPSLAAFVALLADEPAWLLDEPSPVLAPSLPWAVRMHVQKPPERPPRPA